MSLCCWSKSEETSGAYSASENNSADLNSFFVITAIFNPASYQKRYDLYHAFAGHMRETGAQLVTIECIFPSLNQTQFLVTSPENPFHIQLRSQSVHWLKENLINIAVSRLPKHARWVAWLDADIEFEDPHWIARTVAALQKYLVVQIYETAKFLGPDGEVLRIDHSFGYSVVKGKPIDQRRYNEWYPHPGYGWAMSKSTFLSIGGLPEYDVVGSGDLHFAFSLLNRVSNALEADLHPEFKQMVIGQSKTVHDLLNRTARVESKSVVGYVPLRISHHWHGSRKNRQYVDRWKILIAHSFSFRRDMVRNSDNLFQIRGNQAGLQRDILAHFQMRNEDGKEYDLQHEVIMSHRKEDPAQNKTKPDTGGKGKKGHKADVHLVYKQEKRTKSKYPSSSKGIPYGTETIVYENTTDYNYYVSDDDMPVCPGPDPCCPEPGHSYPGHDHGHNVCYPESNYGNDYNGTVQCTSYY